LNKHKCSSSYKDYKTRYEKSEGFTVYPGILETNYTWLETSVSNRIRIPIRILIHTGNADPDPVAINLKDIGLPCQRLAATSSITMSSYSTQVLSMFNIY
jgi:hypothetical protein